MRNPGWAAATLVAVALAVTACGTGSYTTGSSGGAYSTGSSGGGAYGNQATAGASVQTTALKAEAIGAGTVLASSRGLTLYYYGEDKPGSGKSECTGSCAAAWPPLRGYHSR